MRFLKKIIPARVRNWLREYEQDKRVAHSPDRRLLSETIVPAFWETSALANGARVLWVGTRRYTSDYYALLEKRGAHCYTLEIDPAAARWGRRGYHTVGDILDLAALYPNMRFDAIFCNGIFGWGIDSPSAQEKATEAMAAVLKPGGWLLLGWNTNKISDPLPIVAHWFDHTELPGFGMRHAVSGTTHIYDIFRRL